MIPVMVKPKWILNPFKVTVCFLLASSRCNTGYIGHIRERGKKSLNMTKHTMNKTSISLSVTFCLSHVRYSRSPMG